MLKHKTNALQSNYGAKASALSGNIGVADRRQEILTPDIILDAAATALGGSIPLDPCATRDKRFHFADENWYLSREAYDVVDAMEAMKQLPNTKENKLKFKALAAQKKKLFLAGDGLHYLWEKPCYVNFPFKYMAAWLRVARISSDTCKTPIVLMAPVRTSRRWFSTLTRDTTWIWLAPFPFVGERDCFPAPLSLLTYNCEIPQGALGKLEIERIKR